MISKNPKNLLWLDLEMTGLSPQDDRILEIATIVTDPQLQQVEEGPVFAIHQPAAVLDGMNDWCQQQHRKSGLVERVQASTCTPEQAEAATLEFARRYLPDGKSPLCGSSISLDRRFLELYMPRLHDFFHYRNLDVSTLKELAHRWYPKVAYSFKKESAHLALSDIHDSIDELRHYRARMMVAD